MNTLVALGSSAAYGYSVLGVLFPAVFEQQGLGEPMYFDSSAFIITLILLGRLLEARAKDQTGAAISALLDLQATHGARAPRRRRDRRAARRGASPATWWWCAPARRCRWTAWSRRAARRWTRACSRASPSRSSKGPGDEVIGATMNTTGAFRFRATASAPRRRSRRSCGWSSRRRAPRRRSPGWPTSIAAVFVPAVIAIATVTFGGWLVRTGAGADLRAAQLRRGADHRLPLRARAGDAHGDHGRHRAGRRERRADPRRRGARDGAQARRGGARQDRHA